ncbi:hypothetical protein NL108_006967 [Boleophthalmus pectinirostris]|nr:hypothetical protein NL108_006967 [Boleophthalmus pectinirostris]
MKHCIFQLLLLLSLGWSSGSVTVRVKPGEDALLPCRNVNSKPQMLWASLAINGSYICVATTKTSLCPEITNNTKYTRYEITVNNTLVLLKIEDVTEADSGFYFCVFDVFGNGEVSVVQLNVEGYDICQNTSSKSELHFIIRICIIVGGVFLQIVALVGVTVKDKIPQKRSQSRTRRTE